MAKLTFGKQKRRINYDLLKIILIWAGEIAAVCLVAFIIVWYFGMRVSMIGGSMSPALDNGDVTLVNRIVYDMSSPRRGDVIAFYPNGNEESHCYIKRVVGLPGETVEVKKGKVLIDGEPLKENYKVTTVKELGRLEEPITLGENEFFVLGDNRENSEDSRYTNVGNVKRSDIVGRVWFVTSGEHFGFVR